VGKSESDPIKMATNGLFMFYHLFFMNGRLSELPPYRNLSKSYYGAT
jgi:hypothetical protein